jgi:hypothetical protein
MEGAVFWTIVMIAGAMFCIASGVSYITSLM